MMRSMFAGVSGLRSHQVMMDVVGNNIANVNTAGYKGSSVTFADTLSQTQRPAAGPGTGGGLNPTQVGLGVRLGGIEVRHTQGSLQTTGRPTDLAIQGEGFFAVRSGDAQLYTRAGSFSPDGRGQLVGPSGAVLQGRLADRNGAIDPASPVGDLVLPLAATLPPASTRTVTIGGNLTTATPVGSAVSAVSPVYDQLGARHDVVVRFERTAAPNSWQVTVATTDTPPVSLGAAQPLTFDPTTGAAATVPTGSYTLTDPATGATATFALDLGQPGTGTAVSQFGEAETLSLRSQDGQAVGTLASFAISDDGSVQGTFSNGQTRTLGQVAVATFANPGGLSKAGDTLFRATPNSGVVQLGQPGRGAAGSLSAGTLEMSNVELAEEFSNLILAQRGFQANSRVISTSDEMLADLVNLKR